MILEIKNKKKIQPIFEKYHCVSKQKTRRSAAFKKYSLRKNFLQKKLVVT